MNFHNGEWVKHLKCPEWGMGKVLGQDGDFVRISFQHHGETKLDVRFSSLELVETPKHSDLPQSRLQVRATLNLEKLETLCHRFHEEMKDNRPNCDDGKMALNVLRDIKGQGELTQATMHQLLAWCHTEGSLYRRGVGLAQMICHELYGRVPTRQESSM